MSRRVDAIPALGAEGSTQNAMSLRQIFICAARETVLNFFFKERYILCAVSID
jgi:hypothetical protein